MIARLGSIVSRIFQKTCPDPFVIAILLTLLTAALALIFGDWEDVPKSKSPLVTLLDAWQVEGGVWTFLAFSMQMCLILVTGHALASTRPVRWLLERLAAVPRSAAGAAAMVGAIAAVAGIINWGLAIIVGALAARDVGRSMQRRGVPAHYPLLAGAGYVGLSVWHGGLSGSAPLSMTTAAGAAKVLPAEYVARLEAGGVPLTDTIFSPMNLFITGGLILGLPVVCWLLTPKRAEEIRTIDQFNLVAEPAAPDHGPARTVPERLDRSTTIAWLLAIPLMLGFLRYGFVQGRAAFEATAVPGAEWPGTFALTLLGFGRLGLNEINALMLALGLLLHGSPIAYMKAIEDGARGCAGIIVQFPLYAGIMAMMDASGLISKLARWFIENGTETTIPLMSFVSAAIVNLFVPSGGGQWGIQGPIALESGLTRGIDPGVMIMTVAYGDQLTNLLQPFWALPLLAITGVQARDIVGYTTVIMIFSGIWTAIGLMVF